MRRNLLSPASVSGIGTCPKARAVPGLGLESHRKPNAKPTKVGAEVALGGVSAVLGKRFRKAPS